MCLSGPYGIRRGWKRKWVVMKTVGMEEARPEANVEKHRKESAKDLSVDPPSHTLRRHTAFRAGTGSFPSADPAQPISRKGKAYTGADLRTLGKERHPYRCLMTTSTPYPRPGSQPALLSFPGLPGQSPEVAPVTIFCIQNLRVPSLTCVT